MPRPVEVLVQARREILRDVLKTLLLSYTTCNYCSFTVRSFPLLSPRRCRVIEASRVQYHSTRAERRFPLSARSIFSPDDAGGGESSSHKKGPKARRPSPQPTTSKAAAAAAANDDAKAKQVDQEVSPELFLTAYRRWLIKEDSAM